jgi:hypothetical protein
MSNAVIEWWPMTRREGVMLWRVNCKVLLAFADHTLDAIWDHGGRGTDVNPVSESRFA